MERYPDRHDVDQILDSAKLLPPIFRPQVMPIAERLLRAGLGRAEELLEYWDDNDE